MSPCRAGLVVLCLLVSLPAATGHAYLAKPAARNVVAGDTCKHCLQAGGPGTVITRGSGIWPTKLDPVSHGLCGDPVQGRDPVPFKDEPYLKPDPVQAVYTAGTVVEFQIGVSTHHMGHYEFRICNKALSADTFASAVEGQACLDQWVLHRAPPEAGCKPNGPADCQPLDEDHPERWYLPPPNHDTQVAGSDWSDSDYTKSADAGEYHTMKYIIPAGLSCEHCTLQWYWSTGNTCLYDMGYATYFKKMQSLGWDAGKWAPQAIASWATEKTVTCGPKGKGMFPEEFWNCADIKVVPGGPTPAPTPAPPTPPTPQPVATPMPVAPTPSPGPCNALWGQCGGNSWSGTSCCESGSFCKMQNVWYSQCVPGTAPAPPPTPMPQNPAPTPAPLVVPAPSPVSGPAPAPPAGGTCTCSKSTAWDGGFAQFAGGAGFCDQNFGGSSPYISAGGGAGSGGGWSGTEPCTSGQYSFSQDGTWSISMTASQAQGKVPYRAFAYTQFCNGKQYSECWAGQSKVSFSFSFMVREMDKIGAYVKLLFWTDAGNIIGLLPPNHPKGNGQFRLITFMNDDYPNSWKGEAPIQDGTWYQVQVDFAPSTQAVTVSLDGAKVADGSIPVNMLSANNGPQIGIYSFDFGGSSAWPSTVTMSLRDACIGTLSCSTATPAPTTKAPTTTMPATTTDKAEPEPEPEPEPACAQFCGLTNLQLSGSWCNASSDQQTCSKSFVTKGSIAMPCSWHTGCGCFADGAELQYCGDLAKVCAESTTTTTTPAATPMPTAVPTFAPTPAPAPVPLPPSTWDGANMKMTHYWDCNGQGCDSTTLQPWDESKYISPPGYGPQDPADFGGAMYGEKMWVTGAASDALSALMGPDDGCCGDDPRGGCGKCAVVQNPDSLHPEWTAVVMKKNRCPPWTNGCAAGEPHFDIAAPGFDNLQWSTANVCGIRPGTGFESQSQSEALGSWWEQCSNTADCAHLCDKLPTSFRKGCKLFASWGWKRGDPSRVKFRAVACPPEFVKHVGALFGPGGAAGAALLDLAVNGSVASAPTLLQLPASEPVQAEVMPHDARRRLGAEERSSARPYTKSSGFLAMRFDALMQVVQKMRRISILEPSGEDGDVDAEL